MASAKTLKDIEDWFQKFDQIQQSPDGLEESVMKLADLFYYLPKIDTSNFNPIEKQTKNKIEHAIKDEEQDFIKWHNSNSFWLLLLSFQSEFFGACAMQNFATRWIQVERRSSFSLIRGDPRTSVVTAFFMKAFIDAASANLDPYLYIQAFFYGKGFCTYMKHPDDEQNQINIADDRNRKFSMFAYWLSRHIKETDIPLFKNKTLKNFAFLIIVCQKLEQFSIPNIKRKALLYLLLTFDRIKGKIYYGKLRYPNTTNNQRAHRKLCGELFQFTDDGLAIKFNNVQMRVLFLMECLDDIIEIIDIEKSIDPWQTHEEFFQKLLEQLYNHFYPISIVASTSQVTASSSQVASCSSCVASESGPSVRVRADKSFNPEKNEELKLLLNELVRTEVISKDVAVETYSGSGLCRLFVNVSDSIDNFERRYQDYVAKKINLFELTEKARKFLTLHSLCKELKSNARESTDLKKLIEKNQRRRRSGINIFE